MMKSLHLVEEMTPIHAVISSLNQEYANWVRDIDIQEKLTTEVSNDSIYSNHFTYYSYLQGINAVFN